MSERNHSPKAETPPFNSPMPLPNQPQNKRKLVYIIGGSALFAIVAVGLFQIFRAEDGNAATDLNGSQTPQQRHQIVLNTTLAKVNGQTITWEHIARRCVARYGREMLDNLINQMVIQQACQRHNVTVTKREVDNEIRRIAETFKLTPDNYLQMLFVERNITATQYQNDVIWPMLAMKKIAAPRVKVTQEDLKKAFIRDYGERVKVKMILFDNLRRATEVHAKAVRIPTDFGRLAQQYSIDQTSRSLGGDIPPIRRYSGSIELEKEAFRMKKGQISQVITVASKRYVILLCEGRTKPTITHIEQVQKELTKQLVEEKTRVIVAQVFEKLRRQTRVDNFMTGTQSGSQQMGPSTGKATVSSKFPKHPVAPSPGPGPIR